ncbi:putative disease resistance protein At3g14460 [Arachis stenosperma]|uniref:putative disease resistance protein At3g14460 n=1 Tax=Arachis stenosperma TaxID=217475 RepID=UPI0025ACB8F7|nr:putative disease resistance protein At3g14460 [Arachis stenosperma]
MAGALIGGAFLSGFINVVFDRFLSSEAANLIIGKKLGPDLVERLRISLHAAEALVDDAEYKQLDNPSVKDWLNSLRDAVYVADDLLDSVLTKEATRKEVRSFWTISFLNQDREIVDKMEDVVRRINFFEKQKDFLGLEKTTKRNFLSWRIPSTSLAEGNIFGREKEQDEIIKIINDNREHQLSVIPIVGIGGVGKTTLAQWLYNNDKLMEGFQVKEWVCISEHFDIVQVTKSIIGQNAQRIDDFNSLQLELKEKLSAKKFFIVLDDVWSDDGDVWKKFKTPFQYGAKGSTILVTTRVKEVASVVQTCPPYVLSELSEDCCWSVFATNACFPESNGSPTLEEIGRKIVKKCKGLPLAVETLGRMLRTKHNVKEWEDVLISDIWEFFVKNSKIIPALLISYFHLPAHLKRCFVHCSLYPKDYDFDKAELILLWMAEDLLRPPKRGESLEEVGCECFDELASRLFFKQHKDSSKNFVMHDLLHDLALFLAGDFYCRFKELGDAERICPQTRHLSYESLSHLISNDFDSISKVESLRTFLPTKIFSCSDNIDCVTCILISKLKYLRVLSFLWFTKLDVLPDSIGELTYLRYLNLSRTSIKILPDSLCDLYNLQTLKLDDCSSLTMLPNSMHKLVNLQHLYIKRTSLKEMPGRMSKLKKLHILSNFVVGKHEDNGIQELGGLLNLHGSFEIKKLENVADVKEARSARITDKKNIDKLQLEWSSSDDMVSNTEKERDILHSLQPHNGLKALTITGYKGTTFPKWVGNRSYNNMTRVSLVSCTNCCMLPSLGQLPSLKSLRIQGFDQLRSIGMEFYQNEDDHSSLHIAPFPSLETLEFSDMPSWEVWHLSNSETFPQLRKLEITDCPMLKEDMLNQVFLQIIFSLSEGSKIRKLLVGEDHFGSSQRMILEGDTLIISGYKSVVESAFEAMSINHLVCLQELRIIQCWFAVSFQGNRLPESLQKLTIENCGELEFGDQHQLNYNLLDLSIEAGSCSSLTSFSLDAFPNLKTLKISECENLKSLSLSQPPHTALQHLTIYSCPEFVSFTGEGLAAPNLTHLEITDCNKLEALPSDMNTLLPNLKSLHMLHCLGICRLPEGGLPPNLIELTIGGCEEQLKDLSWMGNLDSLTHFTILGFDCDSLKSFPEAGSLPQLPSLTTLKISWFENLETLECKELLPLTSLQQLIIEECHELQKMAGEMLPSSLLLLQVERCPLLAEGCKMKHQQVWPKLSHIRTIEVDGEHIF